MKHQTTKKKFYNKWIYKCSFYFPQSKSLRYQLESLKYLNKDILDLAGLLTSFGKDKYHLRVEGKTCDVYCNDADIFEKLKSLLSDKLVLVSSPELQNVDRLIQQKRTILCKRLPFHRYRHKVYLQPHRLDDRAHRSQYIDWLNTQHPRIYITQRTKDWFIRTEWNWDRRYMYVDNEQTLLILKMKNNEALGTMYTYDVCDK